MVKNLLLLFLCFLSLCCFSQAQEASKKETFDWILTKLQVCDAYVKVPSIAMSVRYDEGECIITFWDENKNEQNILLSNLNPSTISWETENRQALFQNEMILKISAANNANAANNCDMKDKNTKSVTRIEIHVNVAKLNNPKDPDLKERISKAFKHLIVLCGGVEVPEKF